MDYDVLKVYIASMVEGFIHRDIKLSNVALNEQKRVKIIDFGMATKLTETQQVQGVFGTRKMGFMAPEIRNNESYDANVDWWSLGVLTYILVMPKNHDGKLNGPFGESSNET